MISRKEKINNTRIIATAILNGDAEIITVTTNNKLVYQLIDRTREKRERKAEAKARVGSVVINVG